MSDYVGSERGEHSGVTGFEADRTWKENKPRNEAGVILRLQRAN